MTKLFFFFCNFRSLKIDIFVLHTLVHIIFTNMLRIEKFTVQDFLYVRRRLSDLL